MIISPAIANPEEFAEYVAEIRKAEVLMGENKYGPTESESTEFRRRLCWARDLPIGHMIERDDILAVCGAQGALANDIDILVGQPTYQSMKAGTPAFPFGNQPEKGYDPA